MTRPGAVWTASHTTFTVFAGSATAVWLDLISPTPRRVVMERAPSGWWTAQVSGIEVGQTYGYRTDGGRKWPHLHHPSKRLVDPYARAISGYRDWHPSTDATSDQDSGPYVPQSVVVAPAAVQTWNRPRHSDAALVVYEAHVKGLTQQHPGVPPALRGTYAGLAHPVVIQHLQRLGVTAIELLPVHASVDETHLLAGGRSNYWGYNTLGFFAPHHPFTACKRPEDGPDEFRAMVRSFHAAGIEVWLDVVYNHTAEGGEGGPILSWKGLDNATYYRQKKGHYEDVTGCGNTLDIRQPVVQELILDSLRYWVEDMGVDGFRFDLAMALARGVNGVDPRGPLLQRIATDPVLSWSRLIAEPWDLGPGGYGMGCFGPRWKEWNGPFRDTVRDLWSGRQVAPIVLHNRLCGSPDIFDERGAQASLNFITCHDGFTLTDWTAFRRKRNRANGENNRDGSNDNRSPDTGVDGQTENADVLALRARLQRAMLATLVLADGIVMLLGGDEMGRTQRGNNNAYCQDNPLSWVDWNSADDDLTEWMAEVLALRRQHPLLGQLSGPLAIDTLERQGDAWLWHRAQADTHMLIVFCTGNEQPLVLPLGQWKRRWCSTTEDPFDPMKIGSQSVIVFDGRAPMQPLDASQGVSGAR
jgi:isoamylase